MKIYITDRDEVREVKLKAWEDGSWSPDCFADLADTMPQDYPVADDIGEAASDADCAMTESEYSEVICWWETEIEKYNAHDAGSWFSECCGDPDAEWSRGIEYCLLHD